MIKLVRSKLSSIVTNWLYLDNYDSTKDKNIKVELDYREAKRAEIFEKGTSKRIWGELYKVIDSSDVIIQVLDARDPMGTR